MTKIEWTHRAGFRGETWNPTTGCTKLRTGCKNCYANRMARRLAGRAGYPEAPNHFDVTLHPDRLEIPYRWVKQRSIFVCSMGDLFHKKVPFDFVDRVMIVVAENPQHTFMFLTKRVERMFDYFYGENVFDYLESPTQNYWLGVTVEDQDAADESHAYFKLTPAPIKFVSYEPAVGYVNWRGWDFVDWMISGGETGPGARPSHPDWHRAMRDYAQKYNIAYFFKSWGEWLPYTDWPHDWHGWTICQYWGNSSTGKPDMIQVGRRRSGNLLDGREWNEWPDVSAQR